MRKSLITFVAFIFVVAAAWWVWAPSVDRLVYRQQFNQSERLITAIETFEFEEGHLPTEKEVTALKAELGLPADEQCPCYLVEGDGRFIIWFGYQTTGSSMVYDSRTAEWAPRS